MFDLFFPTKPTKDECGESLLTRVNLLLLLLLPQINLLLLLLLL